MYIVRVLTPEGKYAYLSRGRVVRKRNATHYYHPSGAKRAAESWRAKFTDAPTMTWVLPT